MSAWRAIDQLRLARVSRVNATARSASPYAFAAPRACRTQVNDVAAESTNKVVARDLASASLGVGKSGKLPEAIRHKAPQRRIGLFSAPVTKIAGRSMQLTNREAADSEMPRTSVSPVSAPRHPVAMGAARAAHP